MEQAHRQPASDSSAALTENASYRAEQDTVGTVLHIIAGPQRQLICQWQLFCRAGAGGLSLLLYNAFL